jgi:hypothetical protein
MCICRISTARALKFLRNRNLIHRDIKPQVSYLIVICHIVLMIVQESLAESGLT